MTAIRRLLPLVLALGVGCTRDATPDVPHDRAASESDGVQPPSKTAGPRPAPAEAPSTYREPPKDVVRIVDAAPTPALATSPDGARALILRRPANPPIEVVSRPFARLAGVRVDLDRGAERQLRFWDALALVDLESGEKTPVELPKGTAVSWYRWAPDGSGVAFTTHDEDGVHLWRLDAATGAAQRLARGTVSDIAGAPAVWMPGGKSLLVRFVPASRTAPPPEPRVPSGPIVTDTVGEKAVNRTYQDLLTDPHDEDLFEHFATVQLGIVPADGSAPKLVGEPAIVQSATPSPGGEHILVVRLRRPFSYRVPYYRFARVVEVIDKEAKVIRVVADQEVADAVPIGGVRVGARRVQWRADRPSTLVWREALDEGDPDRKAEYRDRLMQHSAPFADVPEEIARTQQRLNDVSWTQQEGVALLTEYDRDRRWTTTWAYDFNEGGKNPRKLSDRSIRDAYGDKGRPVRRRRPDGTSVVIVVDGSIFLSGRGASPEGARPFLDRMSLADASTERLFWADEGTHTSFVDFVLTEDQSAFLVRKESKDEPPNYFVRSASGSRAVTEFPHPHPQLSKVEKRILKYKRRDGVPLSGTLYLPPGYKEGERVPLVVWAYPLEYNDSGTAGQVRAAPNRFTRLRSTSPLLFLTQGYAVLDGAAMPIVGDPETMNDTFIEQVVAAAEAAVEAARKEGVADPDRVGVGGHSYGAFMTANLLAHSDVFRAGIARSGAYNRSLTPFGFQSERRTLWEARQTYMNVSPLFWADQLEEPILLIHGEVDSNSGTFPIQSKRLFHALGGNGGNARLVMLPHESHGYTSRESILHVLAESFEWFDKHVKNAESP